MGTHAVLTPEQMVKRLRRNTSAVIDVHTHVGISPAGHLNRAHPYALSLEDMIIRMEALGIGYAVVFPFASAYYDVKSMMRGTPRAARNGLCRFPYELANRNLLDEVYEVFPRQADRFLPFCSFDPSRRTADQARHIDALARDYPVYGLKTVTSYNQAYVKHLLAKRGAPILDLAARHDWPILVHSSVHPGDPWANVFDILAVARARPDLRIGIAHTARFCRRALEMADALPNCFVDLSAFHIHCRLAQQDSPAVSGGDERFPADYRRPLSAMKAVVRAFPDTMIWGTDTPAYRFFGGFTDDAGKTLTVRLDCDWDTEVKALRRLPRATVRRIAHDNTLRFLRGGRRSSCRP